MVRRKLLSGNPVVEQKPKLNLKVKVEAESERDIKLSAKGAAEIFSLKGRESLDSLTLSQLCCQFLLVCTILC